MALRKGFELLNASPYRSPTPNKPLHPLTNLLQRRPARHMPERPGTVAFPAAKAGSFLREAEGK
jgi:hypothetical protein